MNNFEINGNINQTEFRLHSPATTPKQREETTKGIEIQFATNVLGYYWMMKYFYPFLKQSRSARIVNVASYWAGNLDLDDLEFIHRNYDNDGLLVARDQPNAVIHDTEQVVERCKHLLAHKQLLSVEGKPLNMHVDTLCVHGDNPAAVSLVKHLRMLLDENTN